MAEKKLPALGPDAKKLVEFLSRARDYQHELLAFLMGVSQKLNAGVYGKAELCDIGFVCREMAEFFDEMRKESKARSELAGSQLALRVTEESMQRPDVVDDKTLGALCVGTSDIRKAPQMPNKDTPEYAQLMAFLGVNDGTQTVVKPDWKAMGEWVTQLCQDGYALPPGIHDTYTEYYTNYRRHNGVRV